MEVGGHRNIGRPKLRWSDVIRTGTKEKKHVQIEEAQDRRTWRLKTRWADPKYGKGRRRNECMFRSGSKYQVETSTSR